MADNNAHKRRIARLEHQLKIVESQLNNTTSSKAYRVVRTLGNAKNELIRSPRQFTQKVLKRVGAPREGSSFRALSKKLSVQQDLVTQYSYWMAFNEPDAIELEAQRRASDTFKSKPLISIVTPVFNPPAGVFIDLIESVLAQTYPRFELCLGNFGDNDDIKEIINGYAKKDPRIKNLKFTENNGIAANSNKILEKAKGDYIALLDHDDTLSPDALYENVKRINETDADFLFSDKDKIDIEGKRFEPFFKPGWAPDMMLNVNYLTHLNVMRTSLVKKVGGWSTETDGAQDWDLFLKIVAKTSNIQHIPKVLYHWRIISTSTALSIETKPYALKGQRVAVDKYLEEQKIPARTYHEGAELLLRWESTDEPVHIVVLTTSESQALSFIASAAGFAEKANGQVVFSFVSDIGIHDVKGRVIRSDEVGRIEAIRLAMEDSKSDKVFIVSDLVSLDAIAAQDFDNIGGWLEVPGVGMASPRILSEDGQFAIDCGAVISDGSILPIFSGAPAYLQGPTGNIEWIKDVSIGSAPFAAVKKSNLLKALAAIQDSKDGPVSPDYLIPAIYLQLYSTGLRNVLNPKARLKLTQHNSFNPELFYQQATEALTPWLPDYDKYHNPNINKLDPSAITPIRQQDTFDGEDDGDGISDYSIEALAHAENFLVSDRDIQLSTTHIEKTHNSPIHTPNPSLMVILPGFSGIYAGLNNIFSYADAASAEGSKVSFALMVEADALGAHRNLVIEKFPRLKDADFYAVSLSSVSKLPSCDIAVCTQWASAYILVKYNNCSRKCYFIQDKEASFYPGGTISALVDNTYKFGFYALANTPGLLEWYQRMYGGNGIVLKSKLNLTEYSPPEELNTKPSPPYKVFFYARPNEPRNAFELGASALSLLKDELGDQVEIYAAGADWRPLDYGLEDVLINLGKISFGELPTFYRSMDAGLMFMFSGHPGVVASELMASGVPVVVNRYEDATWNTLYRNGVNCLTSLPTARGVAEALKRALTDSVLREGIIKKAIQTTEEFYGDYEKDHTATLAVLRQRINNVEKAPVASSNKKDK